MMDLTRSVLEVLVRLYGTSFLSERALSSAPADQRAVLLTSLLEAGLIGQDERPGPYRLTALGRSTIEGHPGPF